MTVTMRQRRRAAAVAERVGRECIAGRLRMINRVVTKLYDDALRPYGLRTGQFNILTAVERRGSVSPSWLAAFLRLEDSTLSRDVKLMVTKGWLRKAPATDGRTHHLNLTRTGRTKLAAASHGWEIAQRRAATVLGTSGVARLARVAERMWAGG